MTIKIKRAYEKAADNDGIRILVDRIWPRGVSKEELKIDYWMKDIAPSNSLRKWFDHDEVKFLDFKKKYKDELKSEEDMKNQLDELKRIIKEEKKVTLVYGAKDEKHNQAVVLKELLNKEKIKKR